MATLFLHFSSGTTLMWLRKSLPKETAVTEITPILRDLFFFANHTITGCLPCATQGHIFSRNWEDILN